MPGRRGGLFLFLSLCWVASACDAKQAILLGSSGLVGGLVLDELLASKTWDKIHVVVRKPLKKHNAKLHQIVVADLNTIPTNPELQALAASDGSKVDAAIVTLGVSEPFGVTLQHFLDVDLTLTQLFAEYCARQLSVEYISLLASVDAEPNAQPFTEDDNLEQP